ncbi:hypothetical protein SAMN02745194_00757 [Roseomonas rosea]|uniref:Uncharacterized protein n=1 Tax=Muricoccus roseus TaxID=198092 RepID=A0A1M6CMT1_9PROT|nr:hypothetical protein [Roseomonas rosea]SHI62300.1 hypothetical protein SAMN02745194_00757 [Roseomonas rosea]
MMRRALPLLGLLLLPGCLGATSGYGPQSYGSQGYGSSGYGQRGRCDTGFSVVNQSGATVQELYFNPSSRRDWGPDRLGRNQLPPGRSTSYRASSEAPHDFRVVWENGRASELRHVDVCAVSTITVTRSGLRAS